jgi:hypothetical protein
MTTDCGLTILGEIRMQDWTTGYNISLWGLINIDCGISEGKGKI